MTAVANILCVDDDRNVVALRKAILEEAGHYVTSCDSAEEAVSELNRRVYDAVVTDWRLGEESGHAVVKAARETPGVPVVVISGYMAEAFQSAKPLADIYLEKPADARELVQILNTLLEARAGRGEPLE